MPVSIPPFSNVPAAGDPVASAWSQQLTQFAVDGPRGWIGNASPAADQSGIGATMTDVTGMSVAFTADPTRRYKTTVVLSCYPTAAAAVVVQLTNAAGGLLRRAFATVGATNGYASLSIVAVESGLSGAQTRKVMANTSAGTLVIYSATTTALIVVEDIGRVVTRAAARPGELPAPDIELPGDLPARADVELPPSAKPKRARKT